MKQILLIFFMSLACLNAGAQTTTGQDSTPATQDTPSVQDGEAGGIPAEDADTPPPGSSPVSWMWLGIGALGGAVIAVIALKAGGGKKHAPVVAALPSVADATTADATATEASSGKTKTTAAEVRKMKQDIKQLSQEVQSLKDANQQLEQHLTIYRTFDSSYFGEAFRKLTVPMNEAMENGSRKDMVENLVKIMVHFTSLTRYKIAKKQPYDEANIHYLLNQKTGSEGAAIEINAATPVDKIPKNIKAITDLLREQGSRGLDDAIIAGYKIKNL